MLYLKEIGIHTTSEAIYEKHTRFLNENDILYQNMFNVTSDGCNTMIGAKNGVETKCMSNLLLFYIFFLFLYLIIVFFFFILFSFMNFNELGVFFFSFEGKSKMLLLALLTPSIFASGE